MLRGDWLARAEVRLGEWAESATDSFSQVKSAATQTFDGIAQNMAAMLTGSEQNWRGFTRSVLSMLTEIFAEAGDGGDSREYRQRHWRCFRWWCVCLHAGQPFRLRRRTSIFATGGFTGTGGKYEPAGIVHRGEFVFTKEATSRIGVGNLYRLMRGYAEGWLCGRCRKSGADAAG